MPADIKQHNSKKLSRASVLRLELYLEALEGFRLQGKTHVTSSVIGETLGIPCESVRQDLFVLGSAGRPRVGYDIELLIQQIRAEYDLDRIKPACIVGFGNLGKALAGSDIWERTGYRLAALFDSDPEIVGVHFTSPLNPGSADGPDSLRVRNISEVYGVVHAESIEMAVLAIPGSAAISVANTLENAGVRAIWNFSPVQLQSTEKTVVENQFLTWGLVTLSYRTKVASDRL